MADGDTAKGGMMRDELKPCFWAYRNEDPCGAGEFITTNIRPEGKKTWFPLYTPADLATLRVTNTRLEGDRDRYRATLEEIAKYPPIHPIATAVGDIARAALQEPKV